MEFFSPLVANYAEEIRHISHGVDSNHKCIWKPSKTGRYSVITYCSLHSSSSAIWDILIWQPFIPPSRSLLAWWLAHNGLPTHDNLQKRGLVMLSCCPLCLSDYESSLHLFGKCIFVTEIWNAISSLFAHPMPLWTNSKDFMCQVAKVSFSKQIRDLWIAAILSVIWIVWTECNLVIFENKAPNIFTCLRSLWLSIIEAGLLTTGTMYNTMEERRILSQLGISPRTPRDPNIISVKWFHPMPGWLKINTDGSFAAGRAGGGGTF